MTCPTDYLKPIDIRMYGDKLPSVDQLVVGIVTEQLGTISGTGLQGFHIKLVHFADMDAFLSSSNLTKKKRVNSLRKIIKIGQRMIFQVTHVDDVSGNVTLDLSRVDESDIARMNEMEKLVTSIMQIGTDIARLWAFYYGQPWTVEVAEKILDDTVWHMYSTDEDTITPDLVDKILQDPKLLFEFSTMIDEDFQQKYLRLFPKLLQYSESVLQQTITLYTILPNGMQHIKDILIAIKEAYSDIDVQSPSPPNYLFSLVSPTIEKGVEDFKMINDTIRDLVNSHNVRSDAFVFESSEPIVVKQPVKSYRRMKSYDLTSDINV